MEENKKQIPRKEGNRNDRQNGQRISVRPGNFNPPAATGAPAPAAEQREQPAGEGNRNNRHHNRRGRHHGRGNGRGNEQRNQAPVAATEAQVQAQAHAKAQKPERSAGGNQQPEAQRRDKGNREDRRRDHRRDDRRDRNNHQAENKQNQNNRQVANEPAVVSETLRRELDEVFSTAALSPSASLLSKDRKKEEEAVDSKEFEVDIATAAYLLEDVPCGFPIPDGKAVAVVGVRFRSAGKMYFFAPGDEKLLIGDQVLVDTARGNEIGEIVMMKRHIAEKDVIQPLRAVLRKATEEDKRHEQENRQKECEALKICADKIAQHKLDMQLVDAQYTFDNSKLLFYFTSEGRVDFRELVRDLAGVFHTRIELRQIGIRDEARLIGGLGMCGRPFCCSTYLSDFGQVSIKMAKEQGLSINTSKISGCCGRLMRCLRYEHETYAAESKLTPKKDTPVSTPDGNGVVVEATPLAGTVKVRLDNAPEEAPKLYHRDSVTVLQKEHRAPKESAEPKTEEGDGSMPE